MRLLSALTFSLAAALTAPAVAPAAETADATALSTLSGTWTSSKPEAWYGGYGFREFVFHDGTWSLIFTHALDPQMTMRTFQFRTGGTYKVGAPSPAVPGAYQTTFGEDWKRVTLFAADPKLVEAMGMAACALTPNIEADISAAGCAHWKPVAECGQDHDILKLDGAALYFGVRPADNDMCTVDKTPTALLPDAVAPR